ncbi:MAG: bifunctional phosphoribosylaminoimidazolecarboxamide formyltransferase/IMP cyclohydrolase [Acidimicrobiia bacterium]
MTQVRRALVSVADRTGLIPFVSRLVTAGVEVVSSGGTAAALTAAGIPVTAVSDVTGSPEMLSGRVKTLHPAIHGGILADVADPTHVEDLAAHGIEPFQLVVVDLYPFEVTVADPDVTDTEAIEQIDIGGVALIRAAAKNHSHVAVVTSPDDYDPVAEAVEGGGIDADTRRRLAVAAFARTSAYDAAILRWLQRHDRLPPSLVLALDRVDALRYGENPHQDAAVYRERGRTGWWDAAHLVQGGRLSFNNLVDAEAAWRLVNRLEGTAAVVVKHTNPCGVALRPDLADAFAAAWDCDPLSAFGGVVALNTPLDVPTATLLADRFIVVVVAPAVEDAAVAVLAAKPNVRVLAAPPPHDLDLDLRRLEDGFAAQRRHPAAGGDDWEVRSAARPDDGQMADLGLAWKVAAAAASNAVVIAADGCAVGIGAGDQSRVGAATRAVAKAGERARGAVAAGDGFFPFGDGIEALADAGVAAVVAPGGSRRDDEVIAAADRRGIVLILAGTRHFRH